MSERVYLVGETIELRFSFVDLNDEPLEVTDIYFKAFDETGVQIGTTVELDEENRIGTGIYAYNYVIPQEGTIIVEAQADNGSFRDIKRFAIKSVFYAEKTPLIELEEGVNTYIELADAETFFSTRLKVDEWKYATDTDKSKALIIASQKIDELPLKGYKSTTTQTMAFPRYFYGCWLQNDYQIQQVLPNNGVIPEDIKKSVCLEALELLKDEPDRIIAQRQGVKSVTIGNVSETYSGTGGSGSVYNILSPEALTLLKKFIVKVVGL